MINVDNEFAPLAEALKKSQLVTISVDTELKSVCLEFARYNGHPDVKIRFERVVVFSLFKEAEEVDSFYIVEARSEIIRDGGTVPFESLYRQSKQNQQILSDASTKPLYHLYLEGDISVDIISCGYERVL